MNWNIILWVALALMVSFSIGFECGKRDMADVFLKLFDAVDKAKKVKR